MANCSRAYLLGLLAAVDALLRRIRWLQSPPRTEPVHEAENLRKQADGLAKTAVKRSGIDLGANRQPGGRLTPSERDEEVKRLAEAVESLPPAEKARLTEAKRLTEEAHDLESAAAADARRRYATKRSRTREQFDQLLVNNWSALAEYSLMAARPGRNAAWDIYQKALKNDADQDSREAISASEYKPQPFAREWRERNFARARRDLERIRGRVKHELRRARTESAQPQEAPQKDGTAQPAQAGQERADKQTPPSVHQTIEQIEKTLPELSCSDFPVLLLGETGTGKEYYARKIHEVSGRKDRPFVAVNCAGLSKELLQSEYYGHTADGYSGAVRNWPGRILEAEGGTVLLDELGDVPQDDQAVLLRFLQERQVQPVGEDAKKVDVRILAATNKGNKIRKDLFQRFTVRITLPPLRERRDSIPDLAIVLFRKIKADLVARKFEVKSLRLPKYEAEKLSRDTYPWPGNVRELEKAIERAMIGRPKGQRNLKAELILEGAKQNRPPHSP